MKKFRTLLLPILSIALFASCKKEIVINGGKSPTHDNGFAANYDVVFEEGIVHRMDLIFTPEEWAEMQSNLTDIIGTGTGGGPGGGGPGGGGPGGGGGVGDVESPDYFECEVHYNGLVWPRVGVRYKGNSSLTNSSGKLPLRFDFDRWEDIDTTVTDQRFYGFKELSMSSNYNDPSLMREKAADDVFRSFGVPAVRTAYYEIYINKGSGAEYYGVYTMCEVVFDTFLESWFGTKSGNCYKPDGDGAKFQAGTFTLADFEKKTNELLADFSDVQALFDALHSDTRTSDAVAWRAGLESVFDVDGFLKYLAVNNTIQNWDTYGKMTHNYYLYNDPADGLIKWIVWDNNEAFQLGKQGGAVSFGMSEVGVDWPLMNFIIADPVYEAQYKAHIKSFIEGPFAVAEMSTYYENGRSLLETSAANERMGYSFVNGMFQNGVTTLVTHNEGRVSLAADYVQ